MSKALKSIDAALLSIDEEIRICQDGLPVVSSLDQLSSFRENLHLMRLSLISDGSNPPAAGMARVIADSWPFNHPLGELLVKAEQDYRLAVQKRSSM